MGGLVRAAAWAEWAAAIVTCKVVGHDWRTWAVVGLEDVTSQPICDRCGAVDVPDDEDDRWVDREARP